MLSKAHSVCFFTLLHVRVVEMTQGMLSTQFCWLLIGIGRQTLYSQIIEYYRLNTNHSITITFRFKPTIVVGCQIDIMGCHGDCENKLS
jgi:hypothetical protein